MYDFTHVRELEKAGKWRQAEKVWNSMLMREHADACKLLADSIEAGDYFREQDKRTVYTVIEGRKGFFGFREGDYTVRAGERLIGRVYGVNEATEAVVALQENKDALNRVVTGILLDFPDLNK